MMDRTELLESALDALPDGIALFGAEGEVVFLIDAVEAMEDSARTGGDQITAASGRQECLPS